MLIAIIYAFDTFNSRVSLLKEYYEGKGATVVTFASDFSHVKKEKILESPLVDNFIKTYPYSRNLSLRRLYSHFCFAKDAEKLVKKRKFDILHVMVPCNSLVYTMSKVKKEFPNTKLIFDVIDLWPETMPISKFKNLFPFTLWKNLRDHTIDQADLILTECNLFKKVLHKEHDAKYRTLYWTGDKMPLESHTNLSENVINFCYLGSMNNIIDIDYIVDFLSECSNYRQIRLHLIGDGESKQTLIQRVEECHIPVIDHHKIYDQKKKQEIFDQCNYGLNVMKKSVVVGLTMKSLDYMCGQLPIISTIEGDTKDFCNKYNIGFHVPHDQIREFAHIISLQTVDEQNVQRDQIRKLYLKYFTKESFFLSLDSNLKQRGIYVG